MPVDVATGVHFTAAHDVEVWATVPLVFRRIYSTARAVDTPTVLGRGWIHSFDARLVKDVDGFRFFGHDGAEVAFDGTDEELANGSVLRSLANFMDLRREERGFTVYHWHGWHGPVQRFVFAGEGEVLRVSAIQTPAGHGLNLDYDEHARLSRVTQSVERRTLVFEYDSGGLLRRLGLAWAGLHDGEPLPVATYQYDSQARLIRVVDAAGSATVYEYDERHRLIAERGCSGSLATMKYDGQGRCIEMRGDDGYVRRSFDYQPAARQTVVTDSLGHATTYQYNETGQVEQVQQPNGAVSATTFDELGRVVSVRGPVAPDGTEIASKKYDECGDLVEVEFAGGAKRALEYDSTHQVTAIHDVTGAVWRIRYERGAVVAIEDPLSAVTSYLRDAANGLREILTPWGNRIRVEHDSLWTYENHVDEIGLIVGYDYGIHLRPVRTRNASGLENEMEYDALGRLLRVKTPDSRSRGFEYTAAGQILKYVDARGAVTQFAWSPWGLCQRTTDANGFTHEFEWDTEGRLQAARNPNGERAHFLYDKIGNLIEQQFFDGVIERYAYDKSGYLVVRERADGTVLNYSFDAAGNVIAFMANGEPLARFAYDTAGRVTTAETPDGIVSLQYDLCGRITAEEQHGSRIRYTYGPHNAVVRREFEAGMAGPLFLDYDIRGRLKALRDRQALLQDFRYNARDLITERIMGGVRERLEYNYAGQPVRQEIRGPALPAPIVRTYKYDEDGNLVTVSDARGARDEFAYDAGERLIAFDHPRGRERYEYDSDGNLVVRGAMPLEYAPGDRLVSLGSTKVERGAEGNLVHLLHPDGRVCHEWNPLGQLTAVRHKDGSLTRYGYDGFGRRLFKENNGERTDFFWAGNDLLAERAGPSVTEYAVDTFWPHLIWEDGQPRHAIVSPPGLIHELLDSSGRVAWSGTYSPWGELINESGPSPAPRLRYPGQYFDSETGFHYNRFRYYDPRSGSFISPDPIGFGGGPNLFLYGPNPVTYEDPLGLKCGATTSGQSVYVLTKGNPPTVVYVGITDQLPHDRLSDHRNTKPQGSFDNMQVIATGLTNRRDARNIEGSLLHHIYQAQTGGPAVTVGGMPVAPSLLNAQRTATPGYWHAYNPGSPSMGQNGRTLLSPAQINQQTVSNGVRIPR
jgi:RHS repeat-associated protein